MATVFEEVTAATKLQPKPGESVEDFSARIANRINDTKKFPQDAYTALSPEVHSWVKACIDALDSKKPLPELEGFAINGEPEGDPEPEPEQEDDDEEDDEDDPEDKKVEEKKPVAKKKAAKPAAKPKVAKAKVAKPSKAASKKKRAPGGGRKGAFPKEGKIKILAKENPRRKGTAKHAMFAKYKDGMTVEEALAKGIKWGNMRTDVKRGNIKIT